MNSNSRYTTKFSTPGRRTPHASLRDVAIWFCCVFALLLWSAPGGSFSLALAAAQKSPRQIGQAPIGSNSSEPNESQLTAGQLTRRLWMNRIALPQTEQSQSSQDDIRRLVEQIRSVRFRPQYNHEGSPTIAPAQLFQTNPQSTALQQPSQSRPAALSVPAPHQIITDDIMQIIQRLMQHPEEVHNPFEMAEVLFICGRYKEAAVFYRHTLSTIDPNNPQSAEDRAWLLFQIGNCLRDADPTAARDSYIKLIAQYPYSPWAEAAKIWGRLISWYQKTDPKKLISESASSDTRRTADSLDNEEFRETTGVKNGASGK